MGRRGKMANMPVFNWISLVGKLPHAQRDVLEDFIERVIRIYDVYDEGMTERDAECICDEIQELLDELRRDL
jgi:hypothetical protein